MAVKTVYKASSEYRDPNTGTIYLDQAAKGRTNAASGNLTEVADNNNSGSSNVSAFREVSNKSGYTPFSQSAETKQLKNLSRGYADEAGDMTYTPSAMVTGYKNKLKEVENAKPGPFQSQWKDQINNTLNNIINEKEFSYTGKDLMNDDLYKMYSDLYEKNARKAMQDAQGEAADLTGGYGSTYSQAAGQQAYDDKMSSLNEIALTLADKAYQKYLDNRSNRYNQLGALQGQDNIDYDRYRDEVGDWQTDRNYYAGRYDNTYDRDYAAFRDAVADKQYLANYYAGLYGTDSGNELSAWQANRGAEEYEKSYILNKNADERAAEEWELQKQLLALKIQQAKLAAAGGGKGKSSGTGSSLEPVTTADISNYIAKGATTSEIREGIALSQNYYKNSDKFTKEQKAKAQKVLSQYASLLGRKKKSSK